MDRPLPLQNLKVLELGHIVAGPAAALLLADLGADVIKIERIDGGDQARSMPGAGSSGFFHYNRNKRSLAIDLKSAKGKTTLLKLVAKADICLDNYAPGALERLGLGYEDLAKVNPRLLYLSVKGFLPGPYENRLALDEVVQMMGGLAYMTGPPGRPLRAGASIIDIGAATYGIIGILAALYMRELTGVGQKITSGLFETTVFLVGQHLARSGQNGEACKPMATEGQGVRMGWGIFHLFPTKDEQKVFIAVTSNTHWERFCKEFGLPDLFADPRLDTNPKRAVERDYLLPRVNAETAKYTAAELIAKLEGANIPYSPVNRPDQLFDDPHLLATGQLIPTTFPGGRTAGVPKMPFKSNLYDMSLRRAAPGLGEHTLEVLAEAGFSDEEIDAMLDDKVIASGAPPNLS
ncbi:MAG: CaiB/BaiF CoA transferase family protein [Burkholderiales bacterium]